MGSPRGSWDEIDLRLNVCECVCVRDLSSSTHVMKHNIFNYAAAPRLDHATQFRRDMCTETQPCCTRTDAENAQEVCECVRGGQKNKRSELFTVTSC